VTRLGLPSIVVTIGTMSLFRGISYIILGDQAYRGYPESFAFFGQGYVWWVISFEIVLFVLMAVVFWFLLHRTSFGRTVYRHWQQPDRGGLFSGVRVERVKFILFCLTGLMAGVASILPDFAPRVHAAVDRARVGARGHHHGRARRGLDPRRLRHPSSA
jgi:rhamnose transport system permease protein